MPKESLVVVGGGIVGLATAERWLQAHPDDQVTVLEKESELATHQTGHNSGVLHSGIYYAPGSLKARNCRVGKRMMEAFCSEEGIPHEICGKVIVATEEGELPRLQRILERGQANGVECRLIGGAELREIEPHAAGVAAIQVPGAGIVNYRRVAQRLGERIRERGGQIQTGFQVTAVEDLGSSIVAHATQGEVAGTRAVVCAGLHSDRIARASGVDPGIRIVPFRGEYYELDAAARGLCRHLIYPTPDPAFPFLGVHLTRTVGGGVECGPNAVFALAREGYHRGDVDLTDLTESLAWPGVWRLFARHWRSGLDEVKRSWSKDAFLRALQRLVPELQAEHLHPAPAGVRAMALERDGSLSDDYLIRRDGRVVHVCNAPSPAATSALSIGEFVVDLAGRP